MKARNRLVTFVIALLVVAVWHPSQVKAAVLTHYTTVTFNDATSCGGWLYVVDALDADGNIVGEVEFSASQVTHNGNGTVTAPLADLKAQVGSEDVSVKAYVVTHGCGTFESTVAILD